MFRSLRGDLTSESLQHHLSHCLPVVRKQDFPLPSPAPEHKVQLRRRKLDPTSQLREWGDDRVGRAQATNDFFSICFLQQIDSQLYSIPTTTTTPATSQDLYGSGTEAGHKGIVPLILPDLSWRIWTLKHCFAWSPPLEAVETLDCVSSGIERGSRGVSCEGEVLNCDKNTAFHLNVVLK